MATKAAERATTDPQTRVKLGTRDRGWVDRDQLTHLLALLHTASGRLVDDRAAECDGSQDVSQKGLSCLRLEGERPLTPGEREKGWSRRPADRYDPDRMCDACRAYWHADQAEQAVMSLINRAAYVAVRGGD